VRRFVVATVLVAACSVDKSADPDALPLGAQDRNRTDAGATTDSGSGPPPEDGSAIETSTCRDGMKDGDETDVDCGGATCSACASGKSCSVRRDCATLVCADGTCSADVGCSDGTREGFASASFTNIAACSGGWSIPGVLATSLTPACGRLSGNDSTNPSGTACNVADLCQVGWHVCSSVAEVGSNSGGCANGALAPNTFYVARVSGSGLALCEATGANDLFGCGTIGLAPDPAGSCGVLDRTSSDLCAAGPGAFACGADGYQEANNVTKTSSDGGGVLCCRDG
jgi:hypothetical protein